MRSTPRPLLLPFGLLRAIAPASPAATRGVARRGRRRAPWRAALAAAAVLALPGSPAPASAAADAAEAGSEEPIAWATSYAAALKQAKDSGEPLVLKFYTGWCPHCTRMDKTTWKDEGVAKLAESFVAGRINADVEKVPVARYRLKGYPVVLLCEPSGDEVLRLEGYKDARVVAAYMGAYQKHAETIHAAFERLHADAGDVEGLMALGDFYTTVGLPALAAPRFEKAAKAADLPTRALASGKGALALVATGEAKAALKILKGVADAPPEAAAPVVLLAVGRAQAAVGDSAAARTAFDRLIAEHAESPEAALAREALGQL
jgi:thioredoxin-like negative regulator of GroEL